MRRLAPILIVFLFSAVCAVAQTQNAAPNEDTCVTCHQAIGDELAVPIDQVKNDVHGQRGFSCASCHGGDPKQEDADLSMDPRKGFIGKPTPRQIPAFCGKCHSNADFMKQFNPSIRVDQQTEYATSVHGKLVAQGDVKPATCISCHGNHGIRSVTDPNAPVYPTRVATTCGNCHSNADYMKPYGIPTDQVAKYMDSVHAEALLQKQDLSAPTCNDCHGNHGAVPPGAASVANVCGTCHVRQSELFQQGPHQAVFDALGIAECFACHSNHDILHPNDLWIGVGPNAVCVKCHDQGDPGYEAAEAIHQDLAMLDSQILAAGVLLDRAGRAGMEVSAARFDLNDASAKLTNARVVVHSVSKDEMDQAVAPGLETAQRVHQAGEDALRDLQFRRRGLAASLFVIGLAIVGVYLKIRQIESRSSDD